MGRNIMFSAGIILLSLSLFLPWFAVTYDTQFMVRDNLYEDGKKTDWVFSFNEKHYLDRETTAGSSETTKNGETEGTYGGNYSYYREGMETNGDIGFLPGFLYSIYKIMLLTIALSFIIVILEAFGEGANLASMKTGVTLLLTVVLLIFVTNIRGSYVNDQGDHIMAESPNSDEYVNMTWPVGFNTLVANETFTQYYELTNFSYEEFRMSVVDYDTIGHGDYLEFYGGAGPEEFEWDDQYITVNDTDHPYYLWFHKSDGSSIPWFVGESASTLTSIKIDISDMDSGTENSSALISTRIVQAINGADPLQVPFVAEANTTASTVKITALNYGSIPGPDDRPWWTSINTVTDGSTTFEPVAGDRTQKINWYPSTGFVCSLIGFVCFVGSRFEDE